ncbi:MAG: hypothetical protein Q8O19_02450 [Rectinemataceae bacterium]|nr:hypothetical protein [Rectinemataceae bacterium]
MVRPKISHDGSASISIRFPNSLLERVDRFIRWFKKEYPGLTIGRPDVIRLAVTKLTDKAPQRQALAELFDTDLLGTDAEGSRLYTDEEIESFLEADKVPPQIMKRLKQATTTPK